jgi:hypothetical protein
MKHLNRFTANIIVSLAIWLSACAPATPVQTNILPTKIVTASTKAVEPTIAPISTATSIPTAIIELSCPKVDSNIEFDLPLNAQDLESSILNYLNLGGDPKKIEAVASSQELPPFHTAYADIDDDLLPEIVMSTLDLFEKPATIRIFHCEQNIYRLVKSFAPHNMGNGITELVTKIFSSEPPFVIIRAPRSAGWGQDFLAVGWHNSEWQIINLATGTTPSEIALIDQNGDGIKEVFLETRTAATSGGGVSRVVIDTYSWNGKEFAYDSSAMPPGNDRVHYLDDAESAWKQGNPLLAIAYYEIAAKDSNLSSYPTTYELINKQTELAKPYQQAFAYFRIVAIWFYLDRPEVAFQYIQEMSETFPNGKSGNEFVLAAQELAKAHETDSNFAASCAKAVNLLDTQYPDIVKNHLGDWGVANPMYSSTSDICKLE